MSLGDITMAIAGIMFFVTIFREAKNSKGSRRYDSPPPPTFQQQQQSEDIARLRQIAEWEHLSKLSSSESKNGLDKK